MVGMDQLDSEDGGEEVLQRGGVGRRHDEPAVPLHQGVAGAQEGAGRFQVFDDLPGDDDLDPLDRKLGQRSAVLTVGDEGLVALRASPLDPFRLDVYPDELRGRPGQTGVEPAPVRHLRLQQVLVDEAEVSDALPLGQLEQEILALDRCLRGQAVDPRDPGGILECLKDALGEHGRGGLCPGPLLASPPAMPEHEANWKRRLRPGPAVLLGAAAAGVFLWRTLSWPAAASPDAWAYLAWGQAVVRGDAPTYELTSTTPKPLGVMLGALASPLPPERAFGIVVALALGVLVGALFAAGRRRAGAVAGVVGVLAFLAVSMLSAVVAYALIDAVTTALVALAFALRGRSRVAVLVLAGLGRPEAWLLAGVAGFSETAGRWWRRLVAAAAAAAAAPVLWLAFDTAASNDPLATSHRADFLLGGRARESIPWGDVVDNLVDRLSPARILAVVALGLAGLALHARARGKEGDVLLPAATVLVWLVVLAYEARRGLFTAPRYLLPVLAAAALGTGLLAARFLPSALARWNAVAAAAALVAVAVVVIRMTFEPTRWAGHVQEMLDTAPTVERTLSCGTVAISGRHEWPGAALAQLAAATRRPLRDFALARYTSRYVAVLDISHGRRRAAPSTWHSRETPFGLLSLSPACASQLAAPGAK